MPPIIVDASVVIKWLIPEPDSRLSLRLHDEAICHAPDFIRLECANIVWNKFARGELSHEEATEAAEALGVLDVIVTPTADLLPRALSMALDLNHPVYDCLYLALAHLRQWPFITADRKLIAKVRAGNSGSFADLCFSLDDWR